MNTRRPLNVLAVLTVAFFAVGCDSLHYTQYLVANASPADRATVKTAVEAAAVEARLVDKSDTSRVPATIAYYLQPVPHFPVSLGARVVGDSAIVDLSCFHPGTAKPPAFKIAESRLTSALANEFGPRLTLPDFLHRIPFEK